MREKALLSFLPPSWHRGRRRSHPLFLSPAIYFVVRASRFLYVKLCQRYTVESVILWNSARYCIQREHRNSICMIAINRNVSSLENAMNLFISTCICLKCIIYFGKLQLNIGQLELIRLAQISSLFGSLIPVVVSQPIAPSLLRSQHHRSVNGGADEADSSTDLCRRGGGGVKSHTSTIS